MIRDQVVSILEGDFPLLILITGMAAHLVELNDQKKWNTQAFKLETTGRA